MDQENTEKRSSRLIKWLLFLGFVALIAIVCVSWFYFSNFSGGLSVKDDAWGNFGDFLGGTLNPVLSFLALIALLMTIVLQSKELEATREELARSAKALEESKGLMDQQHETLQQQKFETTFFSLLELHNKSLDKLCVIQEVGLREAEKEVRKATSLDGASITLRISMGKHREIREYFLLLFQVLKFITLNAPSQKEYSLDFRQLLDKPVTSEEKVYSNMVRALIPEDVLFLLSVNCSYQKEGTSYLTYKLMLERYQLLEHMFFPMDYKEDQLLHDISKYYESAFGNNDYLFRSNNLR